MKRVLQISIMTVVLGLISIPIFSQAGSISYNRDVTYAESTVSVEWLIDIHEAKNVRFNYATDVFSSAASILIYELSTDGITYNLISSISGYTSGAICTNSITGKAKVIYTPLVYGHWEFNIEYGADNPMLTNSDLSVGGNGVINGKLGVGINPQFKLDVNGEIALGNGSVNANTTKMYLRNPEGNTWAISSGTNNVAESSFSIYNWTAQSSQGTPLPYFNITQGGNVGIGTNSAQTPLHIKQNTILGQTATNSIALSREEANVYGNLMYINDFICRERSGNDWSSASYIRGISVDGSFLTPATLRSWIKQNPSDGKIDFGDMSNTFMSIRKDQTTQNALLIVAGTIHAKEVLVDLDASLADYVFDKNYQLMPLNKVEEYVNANNHLPEIPSATEVKNKGMNMGEMQNKLLQKIEELTLYVIEQQKRVEALEKNQK